VDSPEGRNLAAEFSDDFFFFFFFFFFFLYSFLLFPTLFPHLTSQPPVPALGPPGNFSGGT
jgi:hypothetical protein